MFTGIIQEIGTVARVDRAGSLLRLAVQAPKTASKIALLESVSLNGVCLSVVGVRRATLLFEVIPETQRLTNLGALRRGSQINIEPSLCVTDRLNGHLVFGHIDGLGTVVRRRWLEGELVLEVRLPTRLAHRVLPKGPVALDGVSLTVGSGVRGGLFSVHLIPETLRQTTLAFRRTGDFVNVEIDYFAKLMQQFMKERTGLRVKS